MTIAEERHQTMLRFINNQSREIETLRKALEFYANSETWCERFGKTTAEEDDGEIARKALGLEK